MKLHPENSKSLDLIEKSLYAIALDEFETPTIEEAVQIVKYKMMTIYNCLIFY